MRLKEKPVRRIRDPDQPLAATVGPAVEFFGGDVLPAKVLAYEKGAESSAGSEAARSYLLVEPAVFAGETADKPQSIRVSTAWIKRVVWEPRAAAGTNRGRCSIATAGKPASGQALD